jgi:phosphatidylglycerol:prolipoprotein diacylglycerol transferase
MMYPDFDPVALQLGPLALRWYGLMYLVGFLAAWWLGRRRAARRGAAVGQREVDDLLFYGALGVILGGRIGYVLFYDFAGWLEDPLRLLRLWEGGMSFHGGFLGVLAAMAWHARRSGTPFFAITDFIAPLVPLGLFAGRLGNFINGELWGGPSGLPWAMRLSCAEHPALCHQSLQLPPGTLYTPPLHPSQLYQAGLEGLVLFAVLWWFSASPRPRMAVSGLFLVGYGLARFLVEFVRLPDAHIGYLAQGWVTMGQLLSAPMIAAGAVLLFLAYRRRTGT